MSILVRVVGVAGLAADAAVLNVGDMFARAAGSVRLQRIGRDNAVRSMACNRAVRDRAARTIPIERIRAVAYKGRTGSGLRSRVIRPDAAGVRVRVKGHDVHGEIGSIQMPVHVRRSLLILKMAFTASEAAYGNMSPVFARSADPICRERIRGRSARSGVTLGRAVQGSIGQPAQRQRVGALAGTAAENG